MRRLSWDWVGELRNFGQRLDRYILEMKQNNKTKTTGSSLNKGTWRI